MAAAKWMISIEEVVMSVHSNFVEALAALKKISFYFSQQYQEEASRTLEFIQR